MSPEVVSCLLGRVPPMLQKVILSHNYCRHPVRGCAYPAVIPRAESRVLNTGLTGGENMLDAVDTNLGKSDGNNDAGNTEKPIVSGGAKTSSVEGVLLLDLSPLEMRYLDYFEEEGVDYTRSIVTVNVPCTNHNMELLLQSSTQQQQKQQPPPSSSQSTDPSSRLLQNSQTKIIKDGSLEEWNIISTNAYIWARSHSELDKSAEWNYEAFRREELASYLETIVKPCRIEMEKLIDST